MTRVSRRVRIALVWLSLAAVIASSAGCSAVRMGLFLSGTQLGESGGERRIPDGPIEERVVILETPPPVVVEAPPIVEPPPEPPVVGVPAPWPPPPPEVMLPVPPPPPVVVPEPPPPPPVVVEPPPPPPPCLCARQQRYEHEIVVRSTRQFGLIEKVLLGMFGVFDVGVAYGSFSSLARQTEVDENTYAAAVIGTVATLDALGILAIILFMPQLDTESEGRAPGTFRTVETFPCACGSTDTARACPSGHTSAPPA